jgi:plastocyanin
MKKFILCVMLLAASMAGFSGNHVIVNSGYTFSPSTETINSGDSVTFQLANIHNAVEVSQTTWNANGTTALSGGFSVAFGGGLVLPAALPVGTHYYVCQNHASMGMKGIITVTGSANGINEVSAPKISVSLYPIPVSNEATVKVTAQVDLKGSAFVIYDASGREVNRASVPDGQQFNISCGTLSDGLYLYQIVNGNGVLCNGKFLVAH